MNTPTRDELLKLAKEADCMHVNLHGDRTMGLERLERFATLLSAHQAQAEAKPFWYLARFIGEGCENLDWFSTGRTDWRGVRDHAAIPLYTAPPSSNQTSIDEYKRRLADMCREYQALSVKADRTWNEAIEAAAQTVSKHGAVGREWMPGSPWDILSKVSSGIRALARPSQAQEPAAGCTTCPHVVGDAYQRDCAYPDCTPSVAQPVSGAVDERMHQVISGALFDFMGMLTGGEKQYTFSSRDDAGQAVEVIREFASRRGLKLDEADVGRWNAALSRAQQAPEQHVPTLPYYSRGNYVMDRTHQDIARAATWEHAEFIVSACNSAVSALAPSQPAAAPVSEQTAWLRPKFFTKDSQ